MAPEVEHACACSIRTLSGEQYGIEVEVSWNIKKLREYMCAQFGIPEYEQYFLRTSDRLHSSDLVCPSPLPPPNGRFEITLVRSPMPDCFSKVKVQEYWHYFLTFSRDHGDTVEETFTHNIARSAGMDHIVRALREEPVIATSISFVDLMSHFSQLNSKHPVPRALVDEAFVDAMLLDVGRTTCPRLPAAQRLVDNQALDADSDVSEVELVELVEELVELDLD